MNDILNPYIAGAPVVEASMFFGREDVFGWIERSLEGKFVNHILVLHGQRRVGKTSVLKQIPNFLPDKYIQVFFDLQGRTGTTLDRFLWWLASEIVRTLKREHGINIPKPDPKAFEDIDYFINEFLPGLRPVLGDSVLLLTFDEFDTLDRPEIRETLASPLIAYLRRLIEVEGLNFIFSIGSSGDKLENMQASYTDFFKSALYRKISFLTSDDSQRLISKPVEGLIKYEKKAIGRISEITSGHPYFTQLMCHELFSRCQKTGERTISVDDVEAVLEDVVERGTVNLKFVWDEASDLEKWILATLAQMDGGGNQKLAQVLTDQRVRFSESDLNSATIHLRDKDVITADNRFVIHLMRLWLVANRPTDRVREELVEVNPIANRYIEIGDEYRDRGQTGQAIESYQQALDANPGNLKAQTNIASIYLNLKDYVQAAAAFELALKIDDEDVAAKTGYCETNLALGDAARGRGETDQAIELFQKILVINAAHSDARQRLAAIYREQAERQLDAGQDDEALRSFNRAMEFTPEDDQLSTQYEEILAQKKAKAVAEWLGKVEKALSRQRWDEAAGMAEEALKVDPESKELQARLIEVKDAPRQFKLGGYRREAEQAITRGNWEKAIAALETAIQLAPEDKALRGQLETVQSDQLNAQLSLYRKDAEKAIAAGDWEAAIAARQSALKVAPQDPDLERELEETRQAQRQAKLDGFQRQVDEAITKGNWEEALQGVRNAIKFAPQDVAWKNKLAEVEIARHQAQLDGLRAQAETAQKAQNWDAAIAALENVLKLEPDANKIQDEIETLRVEKRTSELKAFKSQAENAAKAERWDEAVGAWEKYLALEPDDRADVDEKLQHARKYAKIGGDYAEAQEAIRKKRFGRAIELLQGIIAQEPSYKSTSRLLVEAVEANKAIPFWRRPWVLPGVGMVALVVLGVFFGPQAWTAISTTIANRPISATNAPVSGDTMSVPEIVTAEPAATSTPALGLDIQLALDEIQNSAPLYQTSFDAWDTDNSRGSASIANGKLILTSENQNGATAYLSNFNSDKFAVEFEFRILESNPESECVLEVLNQQAGESKKAISAEFYSGGVAVLSRYVYQLDNHEPFYMKPFNATKSNTNTMWLIVLGEQVAVFNNGQIAYSDIDPDWNAVYSAIQLSAYNTIGCEFDNYRFWDLSDLNSATPGTPQVFYEPILSYTETEKPTFEDDFSTSNNAWGNTSAGNPVSSMIQNGVLVIDEGRGGELSFPTNKLFDSSDFALKFDFVFESNTSESLAFRFRASADQRSFYQIKFLDRSSGNALTNAWQYYEVNDNETRLTVPGFRFLKNEGNEILIIVQQEHLAVFVNQALILERDDISFTGQGNSLIIENLNNYIRADNVKFWNLDGVELSGEAAAQTQTIEPEMAFYETILTHTKSELPTFEDDFSTEKSEWGMDSYGSSVAWLIQDGALSITKGRPDRTFPTNGLLKATDFAVALDFFPDYQAGSGRFGLVFRSSEDSETYYNFNLSYSPLGNIFGYARTGSWQLFETDGTTARTTKIGQVKLNDDYNHILIIARQEDLAIFVNDQLLYMGSGLAFRGDENYFISSGPEGSSAKLDKIKFWNLDGVEFDQ